MARAPQITRETAKGQLVPLVFHQDAVAASQSAVALKTVEGNDGTNNVSLGTDEYVVPFDFDVVAISVESDTAAAGDDLTVDATVNGTVTGLQAVLDSASSDTSAYGTQRRGSDVGNAGDRVGAKLTTSASWSATTADITVVVWVIVNVGGI